MSKHHVVIVGAGFGGLAAARGLRRDDVRVTIIDKQNHHLFQPLLYQVATAGLSPAEIAAPIRTIVKDHGNASVLLDEVCVLALAYAKAGAEATSAKPATSKLPVQVENPTLLSVWFRAAPTRV